MIQTLFRFLHGTLRGRLIVGVVVVNALMMGLLVSDLTGRSRAMLLERQMEQANAMSLSLATSAAGWIAADDVSGLQELVEVQQRYPEVLFALLVDREGRVLAATDKSRLGLYVTDLPSQVRQTVLSETATLVDVASPAMVGGLHVGWARVGVGQQAAGRKLAEITRDGVAYALAAIAIGSLLAWVMGHLITRRLYAVQRTFEEIRCGNRLARSHLRGTDEAAVIANDFNSMLDAMAQSDAQLQVSEERYRVLIQKVQAAIVLYDGQGRILDSNPLAQDILGLSAQQLLGKALADPVWHFLRADGADLPVAEHPVSLVLASKKPLANRELGISRADRKGGDAVVWVLLSAEPEYDDAGAVTRVIVSFVDISQRKRAEESQHRLNRELRAISSCNQTLMRATDEQSLLNAICRIVCDEAGYRMAWVGFAEHDEARSIRAVARAGVEDDCIEQAKFTWADNAHGSSPAGVALRTGRTACIQDFEAADPAEPADAWRDLALQRGLRSSIALPLKDEKDNTFGSLNIYSTQPMAFSTEETRLLEELAGDLAFGIGTLRGRAERKRQEALKEQYLRFFRLSTEAMCIADPFGRFLQVNPAMTQLTGYSEVELESRPFLDFIHPDDRQRTADEMARQVVAGASLQFENRYLCRNGAILLLSWNAYYDKTDGVTYAAARDVTEIKRAELTLRESEETLRTITASAQDAVLMMDHTGKITLWNAAAQRIFGYSSEEAIGKELHPLLAPTRFLDAFHGAFGRFSSSGAGAVIGKTVELAALRKDGTEFPLELSLSAVKIRDRWHAVGIARDITERQLAQAALLQSEHSLKEAQRLALLGNWELDLRTQALQWSDEIYRIFEVDPEHFGASYATFLDAIHPQDRELVDKAYADSVSNRRPYEIGHRLLMKDGRVKFVLERGETSYDAQGHALRSIGTVQDVTAIKQGELALERANRALRTLSACNMALVHSSSESQLLDAICKLVVETGGYPMAWVGFAQNDADKTVRPVAQYGDGQGFLDAAKISWADNAWGRGPTGTAVRTAEVQVNPNFLANPAMAPWREEALKRGYRSSIALPLAHAGALLGVLTIYAGEPDAFNETEVVLLQELATDLAFGVETLRTRAERNRIAYQHQHHEEILRKSLEQSIQAIADTVEARDPYTAGHQRRVSDLAVAIAREMGLPQDRIHGLLLAATIHDLGKIQVPAEILSRPGRLTSIEYMLIKTHPQSGYEILKGIEFPWPIADIVHQHHEKLDGSGYPQGLKGDQILLEARILAVADVTEAMASHRPYRAALGVDIALAEIERGRGTVYDASVVDACLTLFRESRFAFRS